MRHAEAFSLDRAISEWKQDVVRRFADVPSPVNLPESAHPSLFAGEPEDPQVTIRRLEDENKRLQQSLDTANAKLFYIYQQGLDLENVVARIIGECRA